MSTLDATSAVAEEVMTAGRQVLAAYAAVTYPGRPGIDHPADAGPAILAALVLGSGYASAADRAVADRALARWLATLRTGVAHRGLFGWGMAGCHLGLQVVSAVRPDLRGLAATAGRALVRHCAAAAWRGSNVDWSDYDLVLGPAGTLLALAADPGIGRADLEPVVAHLTSLCDRDDLDGFRVWRYYGEELSGWNFGRINLGVAHGVPGVALAFRALADAHGQEERTATVLRRVADYLVAEAHTDSRGMITWLPAALEGRPPAGEPSLRHAWCYGTPGVSWTLWELGRVLHDHDLRRLAQNAFASFLARGDDANVNLSGREDLALCHGDAGLMLLCDAFARHAGLDAAAHHRDLLADRLRARSGAYAEWAAEDPSLLGGPSGVLAALLTVRSGDRRWLAALGVR